MYQPFRYRVIHASRQPEEAEGTFSLSDQTRGSRATVYIWTCIAKRFPNGIVPRSAFASIHPTLQEHKAINSKNGKFNISPFSSAHPWSNVEANSNDHSLRQFLLLFFLPLFFADEAFFSLVSESGDRGRRRSQAYHYSKSCLISLCFASGCMCWPMSGLKY